MNMAVINVMLIFSAFLASWPVDREIYIFLAYQNPYLFMQWNLSIMDILGTAKNVPIGVRISGIVLYPTLSSWNSRIKEVSLFQGCPYRGIPLFDIHCV